jgi:isoprenylcysteine carboxyl methyltransferase (ICMT) family protein YpbQ
MVKQRVCELCISVPNQKSVVRIHVYQFGSKADITDITFHQYIYIYIYQKIPLSDVVKKKEKIKMLYAN